MADHKNIILLIKKDFDDSRSLIVADKSKLTHILSNLLDNAVKFTGKGVINFSCGIKDGKLVFAVKDSGPGIPLKDQKRIFDRFYQVNRPDNAVYSGTGLGLAICRSFADALGGEVSLDSSPGEGSLFMLTIPFQPAELAPRQESLMKSVAGGAQETRQILVVEDERINFLYFREVLRKLPVNLTAAETVEKGLSLFRDNPGFSMVLMDIKLPDGSGLDLTKTMKKERPELPVVAQTAYALANDRERALEAGCDDYLTKPIKKESLLRIVKKYTGLD
jgi:CheY-like chemotaxis protein/anti-sigma regulatory factor (Ser/Thr protein kinase)